MKRQKGFSAVEILAVVGIIALLVAILIPVMRNAKERSKQVACINNIRNISIAIQMFYNQQQHYPDSEYLNVALKPFLDKTDEESFCCPVTGEPYDTYYVSRPTSAADGSYFIGCPKHHVVNYAPGKGTNTFQFGKVLRNGVEIPAGTDVENCSLSFQDGSTATVVGKATVVTSFRTADGRLYSILRVFQDDGSATVTVEVPDNVVPKSRFEVVTPAAIAGVAGTKFSAKTGVRTTDDVQEPYTTVACNAGEVQVSGTNFEVVSLKEGDPPKEFTDKKLRQIQRRREREHGHDR